MLSLATKNNKKLTLLAQMLLGGIMLYGCSNSGSNGSSGGNSNNGDVSSLQMIAPKTAYSKAGESASSYIVISNPTESAVSNIHYSLTNLIGGAVGSSIDEASAVNCAIVAAHSQCNVKVSIPAGAVAGSFGVSAENSSSLLGKLGKVLKADSLQTSLSIGVEQSAYNSLSGADGITLSYYHTVINGTPYILVSGLVASANAGSFNNIVLVDGSGNPLPNQQLMAGSSGFTQGATFNILLPAPSGSGLTQTIKAQTQMVAEGKTTVVSTATVSSTLTTTEKVGIAEMLPSAVFLTEANPEQIVTFSNTGDSVAQLQALVATNPNIEVVFSSGSLASGGTTTATLKLKDKTAPASSGNITLTYNNGQTEVKTSAVTEQNVNPTPSPSPSPTPTPTPGPAPAPSAGLQVGFFPDNDFFTTTAVGTVSRQMTLTNSGDTPENNIVLILPNPFSISLAATAALPNHCNMLDATTISTILDPNNPAQKSCDVSVQYYNSTVTQQNTADIKINYKYNGGQTAPEKLVAVNYQVTQSTANISLSTPAPFANTFNNNSDTATQTVTMTNTGEIPATGIASSIIGTDNALFSLIPGGVTDCGSTLSNISGSNSCEYTVQFGPIPTTEQAGQKTAQLKVDYNSYPSAPIAQSRSTDLAGNVVTATSANISVATPPTSSGFAGGTGDDSANAYQVEQNTTPLPSISYIITNSGTSSAATNFYLDGTTTGWTYDGGCGTSANKITIAANGGTCTATFTMDDDATSGNYSNFILSSYTARWVDDDSPGGDSTTLSDTRYANVYQTAAIGVTPTSASIEPGQTQGFTFTLTGGYNQNGNVYIASDAANKLTGGSCALSTATTRQCTVNVSAANDAVTSTTVYPLAVTHDGSLPTPTQSNVDITIALAVKKYIFVSSLRHNGNFKSYGPSATGFAGANKFCQDLADVGTITKSSGQYKALLNGNQATTNGTMYQNTKHEILGIANGYNFVGYSAIPENKVISYTENGDYYVVQNIAWTGGNDNITLVGDCNQWTSSAPTTFGSTGQLNVTTNYWWYKTQYNCGDENRLMCVQQ